MVEKKVDELDAMRAVKLVVVSGNCLVGMKAGGKAVYWVVW